MFVKQTAHLIRVDPVRGEERRALERRFRGAFDTTWWRDAVPEHASIVRINVLVDAVVRRCGGTQGRRRVVNYWRHGQCRTRRLLHSRVHCANVGRWELMVGCIDKALWQRHHLGAKPAQPRRGTWCRRLARRDWGSAVATAQWRDHA
ncbi:hypothetical protein CAOG_009925 [Capsaspora owczarzaki ATCC 30864]|uniref:Uncharacterized protein n=1 Tax=Capsaspora owczarzaki (strain ATCC 30864) TaxID=595528 RepID=A0A0D2UK28_CAPO3|nr:hypothetical protein CAOG_009925 [Capsaspora owczarzaki ATCC 30864]